jgi:3-oxoacyl-[acyl-carrier protein] reductase
MKKICAITGSSSGIGAATAALFARNGWNVAVNYSRDPAKAEKAAEVCRSAGADVLIVKADVSDDAQCRGFADTVKSKFGGCDVLVNNAGTTRFVALTDLEELSVEDFQRVFAVNVIGPFQMARAFAPLMKDRVGAAIVNVSSIAGLMGAGSSVAYIASKGAMNSLSMVLARILGPEIRVNVVAPGFVDGDWLREGLGEERFTAFKKSYMAASALHDVVVPEDVAETIYWLGAGARKTTGEIHLVDGGRRVQSL